MPITNLRLLNFKCFADSGDISLAPLTLIFGRNNTGKSSILQSLLLLRQSLDVPEYGPRLNLRGPLYPAGSYTDIVHQHRAKQAIEIRCRLHSSPSQKLHREMAKRIDFTWLRTSRLLKREIQSDLHMEFRSDEPQAPRLTRLEVRGEGVEPLLFHRGRGKGGPYELRIGETNLHGERAAGFWFGVNRFFPVIEPQFGRPGPASEKRGESRFLADFSFQMLETELHKLRSVGAFRRQPDRRYEYQGRLPDDIDAIGANVVNALIEDSTRRGHKGELLRSVNRWLAHVGGVRLMPLRRISRTARIFEVRLRDTDSGRWANFADVGFGIGQAFPVFVEGLRTPPGGMFLVQEPEIHLHPDAQLAMADFLIDLANAGRQVIVETHSEHLLLRVRHRIVDTNGGRRKKGALDRGSVSIVHVEKRRDGASRATRLEIDELGQIGKWPANFMEEATEERMAILKSAVKRAES